MSCLKVKEEQKDNCLLREIYLQTLVEQKKKKNQDKNDKIRV